ncbi:MAG: hypothetical protein AAGA30_08240 [Planctomycetota bacterium]
MAARGDALAAALRVPEHVCLSRAGFTSFFVSGKMLVGGVEGRTLFRWVEHSNWTIYRRDILGQLHKQGLIGFDLEKEVAIMSPRGADYVETNISLSEG